MRFGLWSVTTDKAPFIPKGILRTSYLHDPTYNVSAAQGNLRIRRWNRFSRPQVVDWRKRISLWTKLYWMNLSQAFLDALKSPRTKKNRCVAGRRRKLLESAKLPRLTLRQLLRHLSTSHSQNSEPKDRRSYQGYIMKLFEAQLFERRSQRPPPIGPLKPSYRTRNNIYPSHLLRAFSFGLDEPPIIERDNRQTIWFVMEDYHASSRWSHHEVQRRAFSEVQGNGRPEGLVWMANSHTKRGRLKVQLAEMSYFTGWNQKGVVCSSVKSGAP